jgi:hypothetical protein
MRASDGGEIKDWWPTRRSLARHRRTRPSVIIQTNHYISSVSPPTLSTSSHMSTSQSSALSPSPISSPNGHGRYVLCTAQADGRLTPRQREKAPLSLDDVALPNGADHVSGRERGHLRSGWRVGEGGREGRGRRGEGEVVRTAVERNTGAPAATITLHTRHHVLYLPPAGWAVWNTADSRKSTSSSPSTSPPAIRG